MSKYQKKLTCKPPGRTIQRLKIEDKKIKLQERINRMIAEGRGEEAKLLRKKLITITLESVRKTMLVPEKKHKLPELRDFQRRLEDELARLK
jgi:hypothetical protein